VNLRRVTFFEGRLYPAKQHEIERAPRRAKGVRSPMKSRLGSFTFAALLLAALAAAALAPVSAPDPTKPVPWKSFVHAAV
jgi:hypothetical protein